MRQLKFRDLVEGILKYNETDPYGAKVGDITLLSCYTIARKLYNIHTLIAR